MRNKGITSWIISKITRIVDLKKTLDEKGYDILKHQFSEDSDQTEQEDFRLSLKNFVKIFKDLPKGILIKDINSGLIDFPHLRKNGEEVYLCFCLVKRYYIPNRTGDFLQGEEKLMNF